MKWPQLKDPYDFWPEESPLYKYYQWPGNIGIIVIVSAFGEVWWRYDGDTEWHLPN